MTRTKLCPTCDGIGFDHGKTHYTGLGTSSRTFCQGCDLGRELLRQWACQPRQRAYARRLREEKVKRALELSCMGSEFIDQRMADLIDEPSLCLPCNRYVQRWAKMKQEGRGLYLFGPVGSGKTHAACVVVNELIDRHLVETLFLNVPEAAQRFRLALGDQSNSDGVTLIDRMKQVELLVLDDLGLEKPSAWVTDLLYQVVDARGRSKKPMLVTSALPLDQLAYRYTRQLASRIEGCCEAVQLIGKDRRRKR